MLSRVIAVGLTFCAAACSDVEPLLCERSMPLLDHHRWTILDRANDPFAPTSTTTLQCDSDSVRAEDLGGEISFTVVTAVCGWITVEQPLLLDLKKGESLQIRVFYFSQTTIDPAQAELLVALGDQPIFTATVALPTQADLLAPIITAPFDAPKGTMVRFHLSNHGTNSWNFIEFSAKREVDCATIDGGQP